ncbi:MAG: MCE family protein, partial [Deltaproteobacteria bacterium]|nr:MCE family protein [Deltaproteobacteria bacterium]
MSRKPNFFKVGIFVIIGSVILFTGIIVFGGSKYFRKRIYFETYFDQSVQGLSAGAPVKILGVDVGAVSEITFVRSVYKSDLPYILVRGFYYPETLGKHIDTYREFEERAGKLIEKGFRLQLASQGITGVAFLNGEFFEPDQYPRYKISWKPEYFYIPSAPSTLTTITDSITELTRTINEIDIKQITDDIRQLIVVTTKAVEEAKIANVSQDLQKTILEFNKVATHLDSLIGSEELKQSLKDLNKSLEGIKTGSENLPEVVSKLNTILNRFDSLVVSRQEEITTILENVAVISEDLRRFINIANNYPSWILFGNPPPR